MVKHFGLFAVAIIIGFVQTARSEDKKSESFAGVYRIKEMIQAGKATIPAEALSTLEVVISDGKINVRFPGKDEVNTFQLDDSKSPNQIDLENPSTPGRKVLGIYQFSDETLTIVSALNGERPTAFDGNGQKEMKLVLQRTSKKPVAILAATDLLRVGDFEGFWHDKAKFSIQQVHPNGTFDGIAEFTGGRFVGLKFGISGRVGKEGELTITRHVMGDVQVAQTLAPKLSDDQSKNWSGTIKGIGLHPSGLTPFQLTIPKQ